MVSLTNIVLTMLVCIIGVGYTSYRIGIQRGADAVVQHLVDQGVLAVEDEEE